MFEKYGMRVGDRVKLDLGRVIEICKYIPIWYTEEYFIIDKFLGQNDDAGNPIVKLSGNISNIPNGHISSYYLISTKEERKLKLEKLKNV